MINSLKWAIGTIVWIVTLSICRPFKPDKDLSGYEQLYEVRVSLDIEKVFNTKGTPVTNIRKSLRKVLGKKLQNIVTDPYTINIISELKWSNKKEWESNYLEYVSSLDSLSRELTGGSFPSYIRPHFYVDVYVWDKRVADNLLEVPFFLTNCGPDLMPSLLIKEVELKVKREIDSLTSLLQAKGMLPARCSNCKETLDLDKYSQCTSCDMLYRNTPLVKGIDRIRSKYDLFPLELEDIEEESEDNSSEDVTFNEVE